MKFDHQKCAEHLQWIWERLWYIYGKSQMQELEEIAALHRAAAKETSPPASPASGLNPPSPTETTKAPPYEWAMTRKQLNTLSALLADILSEQREISSKLASLSNMKLSEDTAPSNTSLPKRRWSTPTEGLPLGVVLVDLLAQAQEATLMSTASSAPSTSTSTSSCTWPQCLCKSRKDCEGPLD